MTPNQYKDALERGYITEQVIISTTHQTPGGTGKASYFVGISVQELAHSASHNAIVSRIRFVPTPPSVQEAHSAVEATLKALRDRAGAMKSSDLGYNWMHSAVTNAERYLAATS